MSKAQRSRLADTIPAEIIADAQRRVALMAEVAAGPGFVAVRTEHFMPPVSFESAMHVLERFRDSMRRGRVVLDDGMILLFDRDGFMRRC